MNIAHEGEGWNLAGWNLAIYVAACVATFLIGADTLLIG